MKKYSFKIGKNEKLIIALNSGEPFNNNSNQTKNSIYWIHPIYGKCVRVKSSKGSILEWINEINLKNIIK